MKHKKYTGCIERLVFLLYFVMYVTRNYLVCLFSANDDGSMFYCDEKADTNNRVVYTAGVFLVLLIIQFK